MFAFGLFYHNTASGCDFVVNLVPCRRPKSTKDAFKSRLRHFWDVFVFSADMNVLQIGVQMAKSEVKARQPI